VEPLGDFLQTLPNGAVRREASLSRISPSWLAAIAVTTDEYVRRYGDRVHSVYVRGSVAAGKAIPRRSDLDMICLLRYNFFRNRYHIWSRAPWEAAFEAHLRVRFPFVANLELVLASCNKGLAERNNALPMILQTQSVCIHGEDITPTLPAYCPDEGMMYYNGRMKMLVSEFLDQLERTRAPEHVKTLCQRITKAMIRCGFELAMTKEKRYTRDLYPCYQVFARYYPEKEPEMRRTLELYVNPTSDRLQLLDFISNFGRWFIANERQINLNNRPSAWRRMMHDLAIARVRV
jgi:hypothetical protein